MLFQIVFRKRSSGDSRFTLFRLLFLNTRPREVVKSPAYYDINLSVSLHTYLFKVKTSYREFRLTFLGFNLHYKDSNQRYCLLKLGKL